MKKMSRRTIAKGLAAAALSPLARPAIAQGTFPNGVGTIKLVVPYPAGGATDVIGRIVADRLSALWHTSVIVENIAGAAANIGMDRVAKGPTDGSTLFIVPPQIAINQYLYAKLAFDPEKDFVPIAQVANLPNILVVKKQLAEVKTVKDLIDYAKKNPGKLNFASSGSGTTIHLSGELFKSMTGIEMNHIPYRGSAPAMNDLVGGQVDLMFDNAPSVIGQVRGNTVTALGVTTQSSVQGMIDAGKIKVLSILSRERPSFMRDSATMADAGLNVDAGLNIGLYVPAGTPAAIVSRLDAEMLQILKDEAIRKRFVELGMDVTPVSQAALTDRIRSEAARYKTIIEQTGVKLN